MSKENRLSAKEELLAELMRIRAFFDNIWPVDKNGKGLPSTISGVSLEEVKDEHGNSKVGVGFHGKVSPEDLSKARELGENTTPIAYGPGDKNKGDNSVY